MTTNDDLARRFGVEITQGQCYYCGTTAPYCATDLAWNAGLIENLDDLVWPDTNDDLRKNESGNWICDHCANRHWKGGNDDNGNDNG